MYVVLQINKEPLEIQDYISLEEYLLGYNYINDILGYVTKSGYCYGIDGVTIIIDLCNYKEFYNHYSIKQYSSVTDLAIRYIKRYRRNSKLKTICM